MTNCLNCKYAKFEYDHDGYTPLVASQLIGFSATWSPASPHCCKAHIQDKRIIARREDIHYYIVDYIADRFLHSTEGISPNSRLFEFPISTGDLAYILAGTFAVTISEAKYSRWNTIEQAINTTYSAQCTR